MRSVKIGGDRCRIVLGNCFEYLENLEVDAIITDPPYGISMGKRAGGNRSAGNGFSKARPVRGKDYYEIAGDDEEFDPYKILAVKHKVAILWGANHYANKLPNSAAWLVWDKREGTGSDNQADCEMAWTNLKGPARLIRHLWRGAARRGEENVSKQYRVHPMQKPVAVMRWCIQMAKLKPGSVILDPFMGSGTTGVAALRAGMRFIGMEIDPQYYQTAWDRLDTAASKPELPFDVKPRREKTVEIPALDMAHSAM